jgi:hypothetical protein
VANLRGFATFSEPGLVFGFAPNLVACEWAAPPLIVFRQETKACDLPRCGSHERSVPIGLVH